MGDIPLSVYLGALAVVASIPLLWWSVSSARDGSGTVQDRMRVRSTNDLRDIVLSRSASDRVVQPGLTRMADIGRSITPAGFIDRLEHKIALAGMGRNWPIDRVLGAKFVLGILTGGFWFLLYAADPANVKLFAYAVIFTLGAYVMPDIFIGIKADGRQQEIAQSLPDVLDQITISVEAGLGFEAAMGHVAGQLDSPLGEELGRTLQDIRVGMSRQQAFESLTHRTEVPELRQFVSSLQQAERLGVPIAQVLRVQSSELRIIRKQRAEENAQKLPVKMLLPLVLFILPALVMVVLAPALFDVIDNFKDL